MGTYFGGSLEKLQKLEPAKISCHMVTINISKIKLSKDDKKDTHTLTQQHSVDQTNNTLPFPN